MAPSPRVELGTPASSGRRSTVELRRNMVREGRNSNSRLTVPNRACCHYTILWYGRSCKNRTHVSRFGGGCLTIRRNSYKLLKKTPISRCLAASLAKGFYENRLNTNVKRITIQVIRIPELLLTRFHNFSIPHKKYQTRVGIVWYFSISVMCYAKKWRVEYLLAITDNLT